MSDACDRCQGTTARGEQCKLGPQDGSSFCHHHHEERKRIVEFFAKHREGLVGFLAGAITDPVVGDVYDFLKETLGYRHLVPPVPERTGAPSFKTFRSGIWDVSDPISKRLELTREEASSLEESRFEYFPFDSKDRSQGFIEVVFPEGDRGASGNGAILVFHFKRGRCTQIGEMEGAWVEPDFTTSPTALNACFHASAFEYGEYRHEFRSDQYVLVRHRTVRQ